MFLLAWPLPPERRHPAAAFPPIAEGGPNRKKSQHSKIVKPALCEIRPQPTFPRIAADTHLS